MSLDLSRLHDLAVSDSGFVFDPTSGHTFTLNPTGLAVLRALKEGCPPEEVPRRLAETFETDGDEDLGRDVEEFVARMREYGLVK